MLTSRTFKVGVLVSAMGLVGVGGSVFSNQSSGAGQQRPEAKASSSDQGFAVFEATPQTTVSTKRNIPGVVSLSEAKRLAGERESGGLSSFSLDPLTARVAHANKEKRTIVMYGDGVICTFYLEPRVSRSSGGYCGVAASMADPSEFPTTIGETENNRYRITGLVPDGVTNIRVELSDGSERLISPTNNMFDHTAGKRPRRLVWRAPDGSTYSRDFINPAGITNTQHDDIAGRR